MRIVLIVVFSFMFGLVGCSSNDSKTDISYSYENGEAVLEQVIDKDSTFSVSEDKVEVKSKSLSKYDQSLKLRGALWNKGLNYLPIKENLDDDLDLMESINRYLYKDELKPFGINRNVRFYGTKGSTYIHKNKKIVYVKYNSSLEQLKNFLKKNKNNLSKKQVVTSSKKISNTKKIYKKSGTNLTFPVNIK